MSVQANQNLSFGIRIASPSQKLSSKPRLHISLSTKLIPYYQASISCSTSNPRTGKFTTSFSNPTFSNEPLEPESPSLGKKKLRVLVKPLEKPRIVLKFVWMQKDIGVSLDQMVPGFGTIPLSPYYFWPSKDAWEELKALLENKPWISELHRVFLLNQATDIINLWQSNGGDLS